MNTLFNSETTNEVKYNIIIGNPPFITLYGRRDKKRNEEQRTYYLNNYNQFPNSLKNGKLNYSMFFIERALEQLNPDGLLYFILDISFFETAFQYTRKYLLDNSMIIDFIYNINSFENANSGQVVLRIKKRNNAKSYYVNVYDYQTKKQRSVNSSNWNNPYNEYKFEIIDDTSNKIITRVYRKTSTTFLSFLKKKFLRK